MREVRRRPLRRKCHPEERERRELSGGRKSDTCKDYILKFVNGTTDDKDECDALVSAFKAAQCSNFIRAEKTGDENLNLNNDTDDVLIDDTATEWACCRTINNYYNAHCSAGEDLSSSTMLAVTGLLVMCTLVKSFIHQYNLHYMTEVGGCIILGSLFGIFLSVTSLADTNHLSFDNDLFLSILLPPIIFNASLSIKKQPLKRNIFAIALYALVGTLLSATITGLSVYGFSLMYKTSIPLLDSLIFGALVSSIDPVAVLSIFQAAGIDEEDTLYVLIFGESLLNDGVAIVLFDTLIAFLDTSSEVTSDLVWQAVVRFLVVFNGSIAVGLFFGICTAVFYRSFHDTMSSVVEVGVFFCWAFIPYYICEWLAWSGIVAIVTTGFIMDYFVVGASVPAVMPSSSPHPRRHRVGSDASDPLRQHEDGATESTSSREYTPTRIFSRGGRLSPEAKSHVKFVAEVISNLMETSIFAYLGIMFSKNISSDWGLNAIGIASCTFSRAIMIVLVSAVANIIRRLARCCSHSTDCDPDLNDTPHSNNITRNTNDIDGRTQLVLFFAGIRGAVSLALVENIPVYNVVSKQGSSFKPELKNMTNSSIIFTVFVFGGMMHSLVERLGFTEERVPANDGSRHGSGSSNNHELTEQLLQPNDDLIT